MILFFLWLHQALVIGRSQLFYSEAVLVFGWLCSALDQAAELKMPNVLKEVNAIQRSELDIKHAPLTAKLLIQLKCHNAGKKKQNKKKTPFQMKKPSPPPPSL